MRYAICWNPARQSRLESFRVSFQPRSAASLQGEATPDCPGQLISRLANGSTWGRCQSRLSARSHRGQRFPAAARRMPAQLDALLLRRITLSSVSLGRTTVVPSSSGPSSRSTCYTRKIPAVGPAGGRLITLLSASVVTVVVQQCAWSKVAWINIRPSEFLATDPVSVVNYPSGPHFQP